MVRVLLKGQVFFPTPFDKNYDKTCWKASFAVIFVWGYQWTTQTCAPETENSRDSSMCPNFNLHRSISPETIL